MVITERVDAIAIDDVPDLVRLVDALHDSGDRAVLRRQGRVVAVLTLVEPTAASEVEERRRQAAIASDRAALGASAGAWDGVVDADEFLQHNAESRTWSTRPPVDL